MTPTTPCPRCGHILAPHHYDRHVRACSRIPLDDELREIAPTMHISKLARLWGTSSTLIATRLLMAGIAAGKDPRLIPPPQTTIDWMITLYNEGVSLREIAARTHVSDDRTRRIMLGLLADGKVQKRKRRRLIPPVYPRCSGCDIRLDSHHVPKGQNGRCGFCVKEQMAERML